MKDPCIYMYVKIYVYVCGFFFFFQSRVEFYGSMSHYVSLKPLTKNSMMAVNV